MNSQDKYQGFAKVGLQEAREISQRYYWTGEECVSGHISWRRTHTRRCVKCEREASQQYKYRDSKEDVISIYRRRIDDLKIQLKLKRDLQENW